MARRSARSSFRSVRRYSYPNRGLARAPGLRERLAASSLWDAGGQEGEETDRQSRGRCTSQDSALPGNRR